MMNETNTRRSAGAAGRLLLTAEREEIEKYSHLDPPDGQRATALLLIDDGCTQAQASAQTGLSIGQLKYWLTRFKKLRLKAFPDPILASEPRPTPDSGIELEPDPEGESDEEGSKKKKKKPKKGGNKSIKDKKKPGKKKKKKNTISKEDDKKVKKNKNKSDKKKKGKNKNKKKSKKKKK